MIFGSTRPRENMELLDQRVARLATFTARGRLAKVTAWVDGLGGLSGRDVDVRGLLYENGEPVSAGTIVRVAAGRPAGWLDLPFEDAVVTDRELTFGIVAVRGGTARVATYEDGGMTATTGFGAPTTMEDAAAGPRPTLFATTFEEAPLPERDDEAVAGLGFDSAQAILGVGAQALARPSTCGWHGSRMGEPGSFALVNADTPELVDLVGRRVRVSAGERAVVAYVFEAMDIAEDISLTRRLFLALAPLSTEELDVEVAVVEER